MPPVEGLRTEDFVCGLGVQVEWRVWDLELGSRSMPNNEASIIYSLEELDPYVQCLGPAEQKTVFGAYSYAHPYTRRDTPSWSGIGLLGMEPLSL